jgi:hypothetical protein
LCAFALGALRLGAIGSQHLLLLRLIITATTFRPSGLFLQPLLLLLVGGCPTLLACCHWKRLLSWKISKLGDGWKDVQLRNFGFDQHGVGHDIACTAITLLFKVIDVHLHGSLTVFQQLLVSAMLINSFSRVFYQVYQANPKANPSSTIPCIAVLLTLH